MKVHNFQDWRGMAVAVMVACALGSSARAAETEAGPGAGADLRAIAIARIRHYVTWPGATGRSSGGRPAAITTCVLGDNPALASALEHRSSVHGPLEVLQVTAASPDLANCEIAVFHDLGAAATASALRSLRSSGALTIGESESFVREGGMMALVERRQRLRMVVSVANLRRGGLEVSSRLLQLAQVVDGEAR